MITKANKTTNAPHGWIITVKATGEATRTPFDPKTSLEQLKTAVAGYIELVTMNGTMGRYDGFCNDEGKLIGLPANEVISTIYGRDIIYGDVVICKHDRHGETQGLSDEETAEIFATLTAAGAVIAA